MCTGQVKSKISTVKIKILHFFQLQIILIESFAFESFQKITFKIITRSSLKMISNFPMKFSINSYTIFV